MSLLLPSFLSSLCRHVSTLHSFLHAAMQYHNDRVDACKEQTNDRTRIKIASLSTWTMEQVVREEDEEEFKEFLQHTIVGLAVDHAQRVMETPFLGTAECSQVQLINMAVETLFRMSSTPNHMLTLGYKQRFVQQVEPNVGNSGIHGVENTHPNWNWLEMSNRNWKKLLCRVGDGLMQFILIHLVVLKRMDKNPSSALVQICGPIISNLVRKFNEVFYKDVHLQKQIKRQATSPTVGNNVNHVLVRNVSNESLQSKYKKTLSNAKLENLKQWSIDRNAMLYSTVTPKKLMVGVDAKHLLQMNAKERYDLKQGAGLPAENPLHQFDDPSDMSVKLFAAFIFQRSRAKSTYASSVYREYLKAAKELEKLKKSSNRFSNEEFVQLQANVTKLSLALQIPKKLPVRIFESLHLFAKILHNHRRFKYNRALLVACPIRSPALPQTKQIGAAFASTSCNMGSPTISANPIGIARESTNSLPNIVEVPWITQGTSTISTDNQNWNLHEMISQKRELTKPSDETKKWSWLKCNSNDQQVFNFVKAVLIGLFPLALFGGRRNRRVILKKVWDMIVMNKSESCTVHHLMQGICITSIAWLAPQNMRKNAVNCKQASNHRLPIYPTISVQDLQWRNDTFAQLIHFIFADVIVPLLGANFYATETEHLKNKIVYYRRSVWREIFKIFSLTSISEDDTRMYKYLKNGEAESILQKRQCTSLGYGSLRLLPRDQTIRPIVNLSSDFKFPGVNGKMYSQSVNKVLNPLLQILTYHHDKNSSVYGCSVFGFQDIFVKLFPFLAWYKALPAGNRPKVFLVCADIQKCFDNIKRDGLFSILQEIISEDEYVLRKLFEVCEKMKPRFIELAPSKLKMDDDFVAFLPSKRKEKCNEVTSKRVKLTSYNEFNVKESEKIPCRTKFSVIGVEESAPLYRSITLRHDLSIIQDAVEYDHKKKSEVMRMLHDHIFNNVIRLRGSYDEDKMFVLQTRGTPQGSVLSTFFACAVLGFVDRKYVYPCLINLNERTSHPRVIIRNVDDYLLLTLSQREADSFISLFLDGFPDLGVTINEQKTRTNFASKKLPAQNNVAFSQKQWVPWCGALFNTFTLDIRVDYSRLAHKGMLIENFIFHVDISRTIKVNNLLKPGVALATKVKMYMNSRCHAIFFHCKTQSPFNLRVNVYQLFLFTAVSALTHLNTLQRYGHRAEKSHCLNFVMNAIVLGSVDHFLSLVKIKMRLAVREIERPNYHSKGLSQGSQFKSRHFELRDSFPLNKHQISWFVFGV